VSRELLHLMLASQRVVNLQEAQKSWDCWGKDDGLCLEVWRSWNGLAALSKEQECPLSLRIVVH
jgi:hypothetical protein